TLQGEAGGYGAKTGLYAVPIDPNFGEFKAPITFDAEGQMVAEIEGRARVIYEVKGGRITVKGKQLKANLADGLYIIRRLTVLECKRLQTVPDSYIFPVSDTQAYRQLGNGWTVDVIAHILSFCPGITEKPLEVLSMYDGMSCGRLALDKLGASVAAYWATEIDKYAIQTTQANFLDTVQLGDAFQVREDGWKPWEGVKQ
ncbi:MAG: DNA cytosine methyltransferase, partial [Dysosmobacter sp.]|nr:DNA cytosine methyltransferase [Dysosmobacter sp.]